MLGDFFCFGLVHGALLSVLVLLPLDRGVPPLPWAAVLPPGRGNPPGLLRGHASEGGKRHPGKSCGRFQTCAGRGWLPHHVHCLRVWILRCLIPRVSTTALIPGLRPLGKPGVSRMLG